MVSVTNYIRVNHNPIHDCHSASLTELAAIKKKPQSFVKWYMNQRVKKVKGIRITLWLRLENKENIDKGVDLLAKTWFQQVVDDRVVAFSPLTSCVFCNLQPGKVPS